MKVEFPEWCIDNQSQIMLVKSKEQNNLKEYLLLTLEDDFKEIDYPRRLDYIYDTEENNKFLIFEKKEYKKFVESLFKAAQKHPKIDFLNMEGVGKIGFPVKFYKVSDLIGDDEQPAPAPPPSSGMEFSFTNDSVKNKGKNNPENREEMMVENVEPLKKPKKPEKKKLKM